MRAFFNQWSWDFIGFSTSMLCAAHCLILPILITVTSMSSLALLEAPLFEAGILTLSAFLGIASLLPAYIKHHRKFTAIAVFCLGILVIGLSRFDINEVWEISLTSAGATLVASAHFINWRLLKSIRQSRLVISS